MLMVEAGHAAVAAGGEALAIPEERREAWEERAALMATDGGLPSREAACLAWEGLQSPAET